MNYKIWLLTDYEENLVDPSSSPASLNYKTGLNVRLHPKLTIERGELNKVEYFSEFDGETYNNKVLNVSIEWKRDEEGVLKERTETRKWLLENDQYGDHVKTTTKFYNNEMAARADSRRRSNIIDHLTSLAGNFGVLSYVQTMFRNLDDEISSFIKTGDDTVLTKIGDYQGQWLEANVPGTPFTLRQVLVSELTL